MKPHIQRQVDGLAEITVAELREKYAEVFGEPTRSKHKRFLQKRITWGLQAREEGGLPERAKRRAAELARDTDLRLLAPRTEVHEFQPKRDRRLPMPGTVITRDYKGEEIAVTVLDEGFEFRGEVYKSLSAVAKAATGAHWNGYHFFRLPKEPTQ